MTTNDKTLGKLWETHYKQFILKLFGRYFAQYKTIKKIDELIIDGIKNGETDAEIMRQINTKFGQMANIDKKQSTRIDYHSNNMVQYLQKNGVNQIYSMLDFGCGNGKLAKDMSELLQVKDIYGTDIIDIRSTNTTDVVKFKSSKINEKLDYELDTFELIVSSMVLHHINDYEFVLKELYRITKPNGYLLIREHDSIDDPLFTDYLNIVHMIYLVAFPSNNTDNYDNYYAKYFSAAKWKQVIEGVGFKEMSPPQYDNNNQRHVLMLFKK